MIDMNLLYFSVTTLCLVLTLLAFYLDTKKCKVIDLSDVMDTILFTFLSIIPVVNIIMLCFMWSAYSEKYGYIIIRNRKG